VADGKRNHVWANASFLYTERRHGLRSGQLRIYNDDDNAGSWHCRAKRDLYTGRQHGLFIRDRNGKCNGEQGDAYGLSLCVADGKRDHVWANAGFLYTERRHGLRSGQLRIYNDDDNAGSWRCRAKRDLYTD
jgi:hypothetical protein